MSARIAAYVRQHHLALLCLFLILSGGTAYAVDGPLPGTNQVGSADIINFEVDTPDVALDAIGTTKINDGGVRSTDVLDNSLTGTDIHEPSLNLAAEGWHEVGTPGGPVPFNTLGCIWSNYNPDHNSAAFLRDRHGFVHLKGLVRGQVNLEGGPCDFSPGGAAPLIFTLPPGYRPAKREVHVTLTNNALGRVNVDGPAFPGFGFAGGVSVNAPTAAANAAEWVSLDGISFRCAPSGQSGCP